MVGPRCDLKGGRSGPDLDRPDRARRTRVTRILRARALPQLNGEFAPNPENVRELTVDPQRSPLPFEERLAVAARRQASDQRRSERPRARIMSSPAAQARLPASQRKRSGVVAKSQLNAVSFFSFDCGLRVLAPGESCSYTVVFQPACSMIPTPIPALSSGAESFNAPTKARWW